MNDDVSSPNSATPKQNSATDAKRTDTSTANSHTAEKLLTSRDDALRLGIVDPIELVERLCLDFERAFVAGRRTSIDEYFAWFPQLRGDEVSALGLISAEYELRCLHGGDIVDCVAYGQRFPEFRDQLALLLQRLPPRPRSLPDTRPTLPVTGPVAAPSDALAPRPANDSSLRGSGTVVTQRASDEPRERFGVAHCIGDFQLLNVLGEGGFGVVYLAQQRSLNRQVALKISTDLGEEARTMASLEHDHIVQVFSEALDRTLGKRLLCMQYVPGTTLGKVIRHWKQSSERVPLMEAVDTLAPGPLSAQHASLSERDQLAQGDSMDAVAWVGARIAAALAYAHRRGVLHRDIKPDNILISQLGRPYLADFSLAVQSSMRPNESVFGGSLDYMSPEHLDAFNLAIEDMGPEHVDERSDIYALGVVLFQMVTLQLPYEAAPASRPSYERLRCMANARRSLGEIAHLMPPATQETLAPVLARCLAAEPSARYASADELATDLDASRQLNATLRRLPSLGPLARFAERRPVISLILMAVVPQLMGSIVNISYNALSIVPRLTELQRVHFYRVVVGYNALIYPLCVFCLWTVIGRIVKHLPRPHSATELKTVRRRVASLSLWVVAASCVGWLPGGVVFPAVLNWRAGPLPASAFAHFIIDFSISGLVAATYSYFAVESLALRVLYRRFLVGESYPRKVAAFELAGVRTRLALAQTLAGAIPLAGAVLLVAVGPNPTGTYDGFRVLVCGLIAAGMLGFCIAVRLTSSLFRVLAALGVLRAADDPDLPVAPRDAASRQKCDH